MSMLLYVGTPPVGPTETRDLLAGPFAAIWSPPMYRWAEPQGGMCVWLVWHGVGVDTVLLGGGRVVCTPQGSSPYWTNKTAPGIVPEARRLGYGGPTNMSFIRVTGAAIAPMTPVALGTIKAGLHQAAPEQAELLNKALALGRA